MLDSINKAHIKHGINFIKDDGLFLQKGETIDKDITKARERYAKSYFGDQA